MGRGPTQRCTKTRQAVLDMLEQGKSDKEICDTLGCSPSLLSQVKKVNGMGRMLDCTAVAEIVADLILTDRPMMEIADQAEVSRNAVQRIYKTLKARGISMSPRKVGRPRDKVKEHASKLGITKESFLDGLVKAYEQAEAERLTVSRNEENGYQPFLA